MRNQIKEIESMVEYDEALPGSASMEAPDKYKIVSKNDTLSKMFPKNWKEVAKLNKIKPPYKIFTGDKIKYK